MLEAAEGLPINVGFTGKGQATNQQHLMHDSKQMVLHPSLHVLLIQLLRH
jgi:urease alpha subunit